MIYPKRENDFLVDDAFGIFIGYNLDILLADKRLPSDVFYGKIKTTIHDTVSSKIPLINKYIDEKGLTGHSFHIYILPFTDLSENRKNILKELIT